MHHFGTHNRLLGITFAFSKESEVLYSLIINHLQRYQIQVPEVWFCLKNNCLRYLILQVSPPHSFRDIHNWIAEGRVSSPPPRGGREGDSVCLGVDFRLVGRRLLRPFTAKSVQKDAKTVVFQFIFTLFLSPYLTFYPCNLLKINSFNKTFVLTNDLEVPLTMVQNRQKGAQIENA